MKPCFIWRRSQGLGLLQIASRIGSAGAPWIASGLRPVHASLPFIVMGGSSLIAVAMLFYLPETKGMKTAETFWDKEDESKMPKADRNKKQVAKELRKAAAKPGQAKITSIFSHQSISRGEYRETDQPALSPSSVGTSEKITSKPDDTSSFTEAWVERKNDFTSNDRAGNERSGRYFHADWFAAFEWLAYNRDRKKHFVQFGVPIRGDTDEDSNIYQFNLDKAVTDSGLKLLLKEKHYVLAHDIFEEQKQMLVLEARRDLLGRIRPGADPG
eukprot:gene1032-15359_t